MNLKQIEPTTVEVSGIKFIITPFSAFKAANISGELATVLAPVFGTLLPLVKNQKNEIGDIDVEDATKAISSCAAINGDKLEALMKKLLLNGNVSVEMNDENGEADVQRLDIDVANEVFCGEVQDMFRLCFEVIKVNYSGFFEKLLNRSGKAKSEEKKKKRRIL